MEVFKDIKFNIVHLNSTNSTNIHAHQYLIENHPAEGMVFYTDFQTEGKGQWYSKWQSDRGLNLMVSIILIPHISINHRFLISQFVAVSVINFLDKLAVKDLSIKWPNDILANGKKLAGLLIENSIKGKTISSSIIGLGLNVNQIVFSNFEREASSLKKELDREFEINSILGLFLEEFNRNYKLLMLNPQRIVDSYHKYLYGIDKTMTFEEEGHLFEGVILKVEPTGDLLIQMKNEIKRFGIKELKFKD